MASTRRTRQPRQILSSQDRVGPQTTILEHHHQQIHQHQQEDDDEEEEDEESPIQYQTPPPVLISPDSSPVASVMEAQAPDIHIPNSSTPKRNFRSGRHLCNSHRKKQLHHITPRPTPGDLHNNNNPELQRQRGPPESIEMQHRGNGVVLDLSSMFWHQSEAPKPLPPSPTETASTALSTTHHHTTSHSSTPQHQHHQIHWRASPLSMGHHEDADSIHWDNKSQTTQEALLTERQAQALTQWLNFVLVGEQPSQQEESEVGAAGIQQSSSQDSADHHTPKNTSPVRGRATTPTKGRLLSSKSTKAASTIPDTTAHHHHRRGSFQYAQTYQHVQLQARHWFSQSSLWKDLRARIKSEITRQKLQLRPDRNLYANVACRQQILELLLSYRPAWLTLALEVVLQESLIHYNKASSSHTTTHHSSLPSNSQLKKVITNRILHDDKLLNKYNQGRGSRVPSGQFEEHYQAELRPLVLYRLLVLIFFLDRAAGKFEPILGNLFESSAPVKSTKEVLVSLCRDFLSKQGDIVKQLARVNLHCTHEQEPLQELDLRVTNFAIDLRDGVRLCRVLEVLWMSPSSSSSTPKQYPLLRQLRIPAISRLQKIHNVNVALQTLSKDLTGTGSGGWILPRDLQAHHIVDGHRRMVLRLVWTIVLMHCFEHSELLQQEQVQAEIQQLKRDYMAAVGRERREQMDRQSSLLLLEQETDAIDSVTAMSDDEGELFASPGKSRQQKETHRPRHQRQHPQPKVNPSQSSSFDGNESCCSGVLLEETPIVQQWKSLLWQWCQQVCMIVEERSSSQIRPLKKSHAEKWTSMNLTNGKALCCLIHYYHPTLLSETELRLSSSFIEGPPQNIQSASPTTKKPFQHTREQMQSPKVAPDYYMRLAHRRLTDLGGVPPMMLLPFTYEHQNHHSTPVAALAEEKSMVVFLYHVCARLLESRHQVQALTRIQRWYRYRQWLSLWRKKRSAARRIWTHWTEHKNKYYETRREKYGSSVRIIESFVAGRFGNLLLLKERRLERELQGLAAVTVQSRIRSFLGVKHFRNMLQRHNAAIKIQSRYRQFRDYVSYELLRLQVIPAVTTVQRHWRGFTRRREYAHVIDATINIQRFARGPVLVRTCLLGSWYRSATTIQKIWRGFWVQLHYQMDLLDVVAVQCLVRKQRAIFLARNRKHAMEVLQRASRCYLARQALALKRQQKDASIMIQKNARMHLAVREAAKARAMIVFANAIFVVQRSWRRTLFIRERICASTTIQALCRCCIARKRYLSLLAGTLLLQTAWRRHSKRAEYLSVYHRIILMQCWLRRWYYGCVKVNERKSALQRLQNQARMWLASRALEDARCHRILVIQHAIVCQALVRRKLDMKEWKRARFAILNIQGQWFAYRWSRNTKRKRDLVDALLRCGKLFRLAQRRSFRIVPHTRRIVDLNKQHHIRCGSKRICLTNEATFVPPWDGHRQNLFHHRNHVKSMRCKRNSGVNLEELPRRPISLCKLKKINQAAVHYQVPWLHAHMKRAGDVSRTPNAPSEHSVFTRKRLLRAKQSSRAALRSLLKLSGDPDDQSAKVPYPRAMKELQQSSRKVLLTLLKRKEQRLFLQHHRLLNLIQRSTTRPFAKVTLYNGNVSGMEKVQAAVKIQSIWRGYAGRAEFSFLRSCVETMQSTMRCVLQKRIYERTISGFVSLQAAVRGKITRRFLTMENSRSNATSTKIFISKVNYARLRHLYASKDIHPQHALSLEHFSATEIQKTWRSYTATVRFICLVVSVIKIQSTIRMKLTMQSTSELLRQKREYSAHKREYMATVKVQSFLRMALAKQTKSKLFQQRSELSAILKLQSFARRIIANNRRSEFLREREKEPSAIKLQCLARSIAAKKAKSRILAAIHVQSFIRMAIAAKYSSHLLKEKRRIKKAVLKEEKALSILQATARKFLAQRSRRKLVHRLSLSQGVVRGFLARQRSNVGVRRSASLIKEAELRSNLDPKMRLGHRMSRALELLKTSQSLTEIMNIVCTLELATRYSRECCEEFVAAKAPAILVDLVQTCNRSLPHVELLYYIMRTLSNVSRHDDLEMDIATLDAAKSFLYLIRMHSEEDAIFCIAVKLLEFCALRNEEVDALINVPSSRKRLESLCAQWERKLSRTFEFGRSGRFEKTPCFLVKQSKSKTDMLILGISYDLKDGVATFRRLLSLPVRSELLATPTKRKV